MGEQVFSAPGTYVDNHVALSRTILMKPEVLCIIAEVFLLSHPMNKTAAVVVERSRINKYQRAESMRPHSASEESGYITISSFAGYSGRRQSKQKSRTRNVGMSINRMSFLS